MVGAEDSDWPEFYPEFNPHVGKSLKIHPLVGHLIDPEVVAKMVEAAVQPTTGGR
ncbi:MAG: hypothetical protein HOO99_14800 [Hyphomicrobiaceae bacterium]|nr:hypothetical protein [Hyphomicrobiaceae bacterium]